MIDPLTLYEVGSGMPLPSPKKMLERLMAFKTDPMAFAGLAETDEVNRNAMADIQVLNTGEIPKLRSEVSPEYLNFFTKYMLGVDYKNAIKRKPEVEELYVVYLTECQKIAQKALAQLETQMPTQQELDAQAQKDMQSAQTAQTINPPQPAPGKSQNPSQPPQNTSKMV
jgi:hypothetical protein